MQSQFTGRVPFLVLVLLCLVLVLLSHLSLVVPFLSSSGLPFLGFPLDLFPSLASTHFQTAFEHQPRAEQGGQFVDLDYEADRPMTVQVYSFQSEFRENRRRGRHVLLEGTALRGSSPCLEEANVRGERGMTGEACEREGGEVGNGEGVILLVSLVCFPLTLLRRFPRLVLSPSPPLPPNMS